MLIDAIWQYKNRTLGLFGNREGRSILYGQTKRRSHVSPGNLRYMGLLSNAHLYVRDSRYLLDDLCTMEGVVPDRWSGRGRYIGFRCVMGDGVRRHVLQGVTA